MKDVINVIKNITQIKITINKMLIGIIFLLIFWQYIFNRSFYLDEAALALNFVERDYLGLLKALDHRQSAPVLFLWITKFFSDFLYADISFRFFPFVCCCVSLYFLYLILEEMEEKYKIDKNYITIFLLLLLSNSIFYKYSTEFKQYSCELMICTVLYWCLLKEYYRAAILWLCFGIGLCNITPILFGTVFTLICYKYKQMSYRNLIAIGFLSLIYFALLFWYLDYFYLSNETRKYMESFWHYAFAKDHVWNFSFYVWLFQRILVIDYTLFFNTIFKEESIKYLCMILPIIVLILQIIGVLALIKLKNKTPLILICCPVLIHLGLSYFDKYPFDTRLLYYQLFTNIALLAAGIHSIKHKFVQYLFLSLSFISFIFNYPYQYEEVKKQLITTGEKIKKDEVLYVFLDIRLVVEYYLKDEFLKSNLNRDLLIIGTYNFMAKENLNKDIERLEGKNGYMVFANVNNMSSRKSAFDFNKEILLGGQSLETDETFLIKHLKNHNINKIGNVYKSNLYNIKSINH